MTSAKLAINYISGKTKEEFLNDIQVQDSVVRRLEIIGEASRRLSDSTRTTLSQIPWRRMIGMRNIIIHEYDEVDLEVVWDTVQNALPPLISELEKVVTPEDRA